MLARAFERGADVVVLDLEDGVPGIEKARARNLVSNLIVDKPALVRVNRARTADCSADLAAIEGSVTDIRIPKVESSADVGMGAETDV